MIENGLSEKKALEALTTIPANLLGIQDICGTVEVGKMANLTISDKPYFEKDAQIKYVFVDGIPFELKTKKKSKVKAGAKDVASGSWAYTLNTPIGERKGRFLIKLEEGNYTAFIADEENPDDMEEVDELEIDGTDVRFKFTTEVNGMQVTFRVSYTIADDSLEGSFGNDMFGEMPLKGNKLNDPK
jgi:adenine deaminase